MRKEYDFSKGVRGKAKDSLKKIKRPYWTKMADKINDIILDIAKKAVLKDEGDEVMRLLKAAKAEALKEQRKHDNNSG